MGYFSNNKKTPPPKKRRKKERRKEEEERRSYAVMCFGERRKCNSTFLLAMINPFMDNIFFGIKSVTVVVVVVVVVVEF